MPTDLDPILWPLVTLVVGIVGKGIFDLFVSRQGGRVAKMPTVEQIWARMETLDQKQRDTSTALDRVKDDLSTVRRVFRSYVERVQRGGTSDLTDDERAALDETEKHQEEPR